LVHARKKVITKVLEAIYPLHDDVVAIKFIEDGYYSRVTSKVGEGARVLEVGCGTGRLLQTICKRNYGMGLDISEKFLKIAKERLLRCPFDLVLGTATNLPFRSDAFEATFTFTMIHHLNDDEKLEMLKEIKRVSELYVFGEVGKTLCWSSLLLKLIGRKGLVNKKIIEKAGLVVEEWEDMKGFCLISGKARRS